MKYEKDDNEDCLELTYMLKNKELQKDIDFILTNFKSLKKILLNSQISHLHKLEIKYLTKIKTVVDFIGELSDKQ